VYEWGDIRIFLAVAREGSTLAAARLLCLNQSTVSRRIEALERDLGLALFTRDTRGSVLTAEGRALVEAAAALEAAAGQLGQQAARMARSSAESIRVTAAPVVIEHWVAGVVASFRKRHPGVVFDFDVSEATVSLESGEADVAFRPSDAVVGDRLIARRIGSIPWGLYCAERYAAERGMPGSFEALAGHDLVFYSPAFAQRIAFLRRMAGALPPGSVVSTMNSVTAMASALRAGAGVGPIPVIDGETTPGLRLCFAPEDFDHPLWLVANPDAYRRPMVREFMRLAAELVPRGRWLGP
jgi:DNA-binding transcriptional LysR family regulator